MTQTEARKILFVQCFTTPDGIAPRERAFADVLVQYGHRIAMFGMTKRGEKEETVNGVYRRLFQVDDPAADNSQKISSGLLDAAVEYAPDVVIFKSIGFKIIDEVVERIPDAVYGMILGGGMKSSQINLMDFFLTEYAGQISQLRKRASLKAKYLDVMPKLILWPLVEKYRGLERECDICVVGSFIARKNQVALVPLFDDVSITFTGEGATLPDIMKLANDRPNIHFLGRVPHNEVFHVMSRSKLLVHPSKWEGVPRVSAEAFACGTPMIALRSTLGRTYADAPFVHLVDDDSEIRGAVLEILGDQERLNRMSQEARRYAMEVHGPHRMKEIAENVNPLFSMHVSEAQTSG